MTRMRALEKDSKMVGNAIVQGYSFFDNLGKEKNGRVKEKFQQSECRHIWRAGGGANAGMSELSS